MRKRIDNGDKERVTSKCGKFEKYATKNGEMYMHDLKANDFIGKEAASTTVYKSINNLEEEFIKELNSLGPV